MPRLLSALLLLPTVAVAPARAEAPDPLELLRSSAAAIEASPQFSTTLVNSINVVRDEQQMTQQQVFDFKAAAPNKFSLAVIKPSEDFWVRSDGQETMTYLAPLGRVAVTDQQSGVSAFAESQLASRLGNGFGPIVFGLLGSESTKKVIGTITKSEYVGLDTVEEQELHHCRYESGEKKWDAWYTAGEQPLLWRLSPDLSEMVAKSPLAQQFEDFRIEIAFTLRDVDRATAIDPSEFALDAPAGAEEVKIEMLLAPPPEPPHELLSREAPMFETENLTGEPINLADLTGEKIVILDFWATWCPPCVAAMPIFDKVVQEYAEKGVVLYAVNQGEDAETIRAFLSSKQIDVPIAMDTDGNIARSYSIEGLPTSFIIGKDGRVQVVHVGLSPTLETTLRNEIDALLKGEDLAGEAIKKWNDENPSRKISLSE